MWLAAGWIGVRKGVCFSPNWVKTLAASPPLPTLAPPMRSRPPLLPVALTSLPPPPPQLPSSSSFSFAWRGVQDATRVDAPRDSAGGGGLGLLRRRSSQGVQGAIVLVLMLHGVRQQEEDWCRKDGGQAEESRATLSCLGTWQVEHPVDTKGRPSHLRHGRRPLLAWPPSSRPCPPLTSTR